MIDVQLFLTLFLLTIKQIDYFKFLKAFPEFIGGDDPINVKLLLLNHIKKTARESHERKGC